MSLTGCCSECADSACVLLVSPFTEDMAALQAVVSGHAWRLCTVDGLEQACQMLARHRVAVVVCECDSAPGTWRDLLAFIELQSDPPLLIVTSRLADDRLWAEVLNLGGYDVLAKPFDTRELNRVLSFAHERGRDAWNRGARAARPLPPTAAPPA